MASPPIRFDGQVVVVTGAGRGLGAAYARLLAARGAAVVVHDAGVDLSGTGSDRTVADSVVSQIRERGGTAVAAYEDLAAPGAAEQVIAFAVGRYGRLDALVSNAGLLIRRPVEETDDELLRRMVSVSVEAPFALCRAALPVMKRQRYGRIVLTTSGRAMYVNAALPNLGAYALGKGSQVGLMVAVATEGRAHGVHVNAVSPVATTRMTLQRPDVSMDAAQVAPGVAFLASSACDFSGVVLRAAGGRFSVARWAFSEGLDLGPAPSGPEAVADRWEEIAGTLRDHGEP